MMRTFTLRALLVSAVFLPLLSLAQFGTVRGFVYDSDGGEPSIFTPVLLAGTGMGAQTDVQGYFSITHVPPGHYTVRIVYIGYDTLSQDVDVTKDQIASLKLYLKKRSVELGTAEVKAEQREAKNTVRISVQKLTPKQIDRIPTIGGQADLAQYMQVLPGVVFTGDQGGQLYIRGGSPIMNKVMLDGMTLYNPFHSIGLFSVFDNDIIRNADIYTGGFNAEHGGRVSSVMDITSRDGNKQRLSGKVGVGTFAAKAMLEGPIKKASSPGGGGSSFLLNFRHSYLDQTSKTLYSFVDTAGLPFKFTDIYGKVSLNSANGSKVNLFGFSFTDGVKYKNVSDLKWENTGGGANFVLVPSGSSVLIDGVFALSKYKIELAERDLDPRSSSISNFNAGLNFKYFVGDNEAKYGVEVSGVSTDFTYFNDLGLALSQQKVSTELAAYFNYKVKLGNLIIDPGIRAQYYATPSVMSLEPRLGVKYNITDWLRFKAAWGMYSQNLIAANSDRYVVNLFYGFLTAPEDIPQQITLADGTTKDIKDPIQRATHYIGGFEVDIRKDLSLNIEGYLKDFGEVTNLNRDKIYEDTPQFADKPDSQKKDFIVETGKAYGADALLKYEKEGLYLWAVYSLNFVERWDGSQTYHPIWDRRHNVNLVASYSFGRHRSFKVNARWNYGSGFPFTQTQGFGESLGFGNGIGTDVSNSNGSLQTFYGSLNGGRLTDYHRLDIGVSKTWKLDEHQVFQIDASVSNAYDRQNIFYFDRQTKKVVNQLPLLPSAGISYTF